MPIRSMTGFAQVTGQAGGLGFILSLKAVNHRFLDLHFRLPAGCDGLEMKLRRVLKEKIARGHIEVTLSFDRNSDSSTGLNRELVGAYIQAFRGAAKDFGVTGEPDLNVILRMPGALESSSLPATEEVEHSVMSLVEQALARLNAMREEEGQGMERELRQRMADLKTAADGTLRHRSAVLESYSQRLQARLQELMATQVDHDRILQEVALMVDRSDIQEELVRLKTHIQHFLGMLDAGGEVGKKLDFLLQEMNREANTLLSKTSGLAGDALRITETGLAMKSEIEKCREQVQNLE
jgi:uncharacterized protein (TIGR00255 family)